MKRTGETGGGWVPLVEGRGGEAGKRSPWVLLGSCLAKGWRCRNEAADGFLRKRMPKKNGLRRKAFGKKS